MKKILCALDFSPASENALRYALRYADAYAAELHLLHVLEPIPDAVMEIPQSIPMINRRELEIAKERLQKLAENTLTEVAGELKNIPTLTTEVSLGPVGYIVGEMATEKAVNLIVVGTNGAAERPWWMSSVSSEIIDHPTIPVLVVPLEATYQPLDRISFATDLRQADVLHLLRVAEFFRPLTPEIRCLHITESQDAHTEIELEELIQVFSDQIKDIPMTFHQLDEEDITEALEAFNLLFHIDLQVLVRPRRNFFQSLFHRSQSKRTASYTHVPLLIWPG